MCRQRNGLFAPGPGAASKNRHMTIHWTPGWILVSAILAHKWRHNMETISVVLTISERNPMNSPQKKLVMRCLGALFVDNWTNCWTKSRFAIDLRRPDARTTNTRNESLFPMFLEMDVYNAHKESIPIWVHIVFVSVRFVLFKNHVLQL